MPLSTASKMAYSASNLYGNQQLADALASGAIGGDTPYQMTSIRAGTHTRAPVPAIGSEGSVGTMSIGGKQVPTLLVYGGGAAAVFALWYFFMRK